MKIEDYGVLLNPLVVKGDCMLTADWHVPFEDKDWIEFMIKISNKWKVDKLIIAGDFFDQYSFAWTSGFKADRAIVACRGEQKKS